MLNKHIIEAMQRTVDEDLGNVVIVATTHADARQIMKQLENDLSGISKACRTNGQESLEIDNGAWVKFICTGSPGRGLVANLLVTPMGLSPDQREELLPMLATTQGEAFGYL